MREDEVLVKLERPFLDDRGAIQPLVERVMKSALVISSRKGALRGNHFHKTDWHYCYVVSGVMYYFHRPTGSLSKPEKVVVKPGGMVFTPPMVDHAMRFPKDTVFLTLSRNPRDQTAYERDIIRVELLK
ncbi:MAG: cupin domain-containing protein [Elusimicrobia bacterium]|nr:cupin domain-containing protein [Elusimicrobiota bacterium]